MAAVAKAKQLAAAWQAENPGKKISDSELQSLLDQSGATAAGVKEKGKYKGVFKGGPIERIANNVAARKNARTEKALEYKSLGGSQKEEAALYEEAKQNSREARAQRSAAAGYVKEELQSARNAQKSAEGDYRNDRYAADTRDMEAYSSIDQINKAAREGSNRLGAAGSTASNEYTQGAQSALDQRNQAYNNGSLRDSGESILAQRESALAAAPSIGSLAEANIAANQVNAAANQNRSTQMLNRQAQGLAAAQGEGGALAMQQALASAGAASGDLAAQQNLQLADQVAQQRYAAAMATRGETVDSANLGLQTRLGAAGQERTNQLNIAGQNAGSLEAAAAARAQAGLGVAGAQAQMGTQAAAADQAARAQAAQAAQARANQSNQSNLQLQSQRANVATGNATNATQAAHTDLGYQSDVLGAKYGAQKDRAAEDRPMLAKFLMPGG